MNTEINLPVYYQDSEFREIQIQDQSENPRSPFILIPAGSRPGGFQPITISNLESVAPIIAPLDERDLKYQKVLKSSRVMRLLSSLDTILCFFYVLIGFYVLLFLVVFGILGYVSAYKLLRPLSMSYIIILIVVMILKILLAANEGLIGAVLMIMYFIVEGFILFYSLKFFRLLGTLDPQERLELLMLQNGPINSRSSRLMNSESARPVQIPARRPATELDRDNSPQFTPDFQNLKLTNLEPLQQEFPSLANCSEESHDRPLKKSDNLE